MNAIYIIIKNLRIFFRLRSGKKYHREFEDIIANHHGQSKNWERKGNQKTEQKRLIKMTIKQKEQEDSKEKTPWYPSKWSSVWIQVWGKLRLKIFGFIL